MRRINFIFQSDQLKPLKLHKNVQINPMGKSGPRKEQLVHMRGRSDGGELFDGLADRTVYLGYLS